MQFRIADTFTDSLAKLSDQEQKAVKTTAFDLQVNPANPGMQFHWKALGIDIRGRSHTLRINYRTSQQISSRRQ